MKTLIKRSLQFSLLTTAIANLCSCDSSSGADNSTSLSSIEEQPSDPILGTWRTDDDTYLLFFADKSYAQAQKGEGLELGSYSFDPNTGRFILESVSFDQNGESGLSADPGIDSTDGDGIWSATSNTLTINSDEDNDGTVETTFTLNRVPQTSGIHGTWLNQEDGIVALVFNGDGTYLHLQNSSETDKGIEYGTYTFDPQSNFILPTVTEDLNGEVGLSDSQATGFIANPANSTFSEITDVSDTLQFSRP